MKENDVLTENIYAQKIFLDSTDLIGRSVLKNGIYDKSCVSFMRELVKNIHKPTVLDVGANIGNHLIPMLPIVESAIAFEPQKNTFSKLKRSVEINNYHNCQLHNIGLSDKNETLTFYENIEGNNGASSFISNVSESVECELPVRVGDEVLDELCISKVDLIKIDVEGYEVEVVEGLANTIETHSPLILMEWNSSKVKKLLQEKQFFKSCLKGYKFVALVSSFDERYYDNRSFWKLRRLISRVTKNESWKLIEFMYEETYSNILLYTGKHKRLLETLGDAQK